MNGDYDNLRNKMRLSVAATSIASRLVATSLLATSLVMTVSACAQIDGAESASSFVNGQAVKPVQSKDKLPYADGRQFRTLDEYLAYRKTLGVTDRPWYDEISPGVYKLTGGRRLPGSPEPTYTRSELLEKFGFSQ